LAGQPHRSIICHQPLPTLSYLRGKDLKHQTNTHTTHCTMNL
jgi:hypothetical protein